MNEQEQEQYKVEPDLSTWRVYSYLENYTKHPGKWCAVAAWGTKGWDLGQWPLVVFYFRDRPDESLYDVMQCVEGDLYQWTTPTPELRNQIVNFHAHWYWRAYEESWVADYPTEESMPDELRGPYKDGV